jgi:phage-related protein
MTETFTPPKAPGYPARKTPSYRLKQVDFGEGHVQVAKDGLNHITFSYELTWPSVSTADADTIETFLNARGGYEAFYYTVPGDIERLYRNSPPIRAWQDSGVVCTITTTFTEVHTP